MLVVIVAILALIGVILFSNETGRRQRLLKLGMEIQDAKNNFEIYLVSICNTNLTDDGTFKIAEGLNRIYFFEHLYDAVSDLNEDKEKKLNATNAEQLDLVTKTSKSLYRVLGGKQSDLITLKTTSQAIGREMNNELSLLVHE